MVQTVVGLQQLLGEGHFEALNAVKLQLNSFTSLGTRRPNSTDRQSTQLRPRAPSSRSLVLRTSSCSETRGVVVGRGGHGRGAGTVHAKNHNAHGQVDPIKVRLAARALR